MKIFLIGMPGCGKTTLGRIAAGILNIKFKDMDEEIERREGKTVAEIFQEVGESGFRDIETEVLKDEIIATDDKIVSCGGGVVVREENIELLQNSGAEVIYIDRPIQKIAEDIQCSKRPLMKDGTEALYKLYEQRSKRYNRACNGKIINDSDVRHGVSELVRLIRSR